MKTFVLGFKNKPISALDFSAMATATILMLCLIDYLVYTRQSVLGLFHLAPSKKREIQILKDVSGIVKPSR